MEKEGLVRAVEWLDKNKLKMGTLVTDRHVMIQKYVREQLDCHHFFDVWHISKGIYKNSLHGNIYVFINALCPYG